MSQYGHGRKSPLIVDVTLVTLPSYSTKICFNGKESRNGTLRSGLSLRTLLLSLL